MGKKRIPMGAYSLSVLKKKNQNDKSIGWIFDNMNQIFVNKNNSRIESVSRRVELK